MPRRRPRQTPASRRRLNPRERRPRRRRRSRRARDVIRLDAICRRVQHIRRRLPTARTSTLRHRRHRRRRRRRSRGVIRRRTRAVPVKRAPSLLKSRHADARHPAQLTRLFPSADARLDAFDVGHSAREYFSMRARARERTTRCGARAAARTVVRESMRRCQHQNAPTPTSRHSAASVDRRRTLLARANARRRAHGWV